MPTLVLSDWFSILLKHSTECTPHSLPERPRRGESVAVAKSLSRFRFAEPSGFRLYAIAGALLVIAPVQSHATCFAFQSRSSSSHRHACSSCASTAIRWRTPVITAPRVGKSLYQPRSTGTHQRYIKPPRRHSYVCIICGSTATSDISSANLMYSNFETCAAVDHARLHGSNPEA